MQHRRLESGGVRRDRSARCVLSRRWRGQAAATTAPAGRAVTFLPHCPGLLKRFWCLLVSYMPLALSPYPRNGERGLNPARRFERDAVGRERVSRPRCAVPAAPDGLGRPGRERVRNRRHEAVAVVRLVSFLQVHGQRAPRVVRHDFVVRAPPRALPLLRRRLRGARGRRGTGPNTSGRASRSRSGVDGVGRPKFDFHTGWD